MLVSVGVVDAHREQLASTLRPVVGHVRGAWAQGAERVPRQKVESAGAPRGVISALGWAASLNLVCGSSAVLARVAASDVGAAVASGCCARALRTVRQRVSPPRGHSGANGNQAICKVVSVSRERRTMSPDQGRLRLAMWTTPPLVGSLDAALRAVVRDESRNTTVQRDLSLVPLREPGAMSRRGSAARVRRGRLAEPARHRLVEPRELVSRHAICPLRIIASVCTTSGLSRISHANTGQSSVGQCPVVSITALGFASQTGHRDDKMDSPARHRLHTWSPSGAQCRSSPGRGTKARRHLSHVTGRHRKLHRSWSPVIVPRFPPIPRIRRQREHIAR